jgi:hypothetical protein
LSAVCSGLDALGIIPKFMHNAACCTEVSVLHGGHDGKDGAR